LFLQHTADEHLIWTDTPPETESQWVLYSLKTGVV
jgi:hypothetical protein